MVNDTKFKNELQFEDALVAELTGKYGWSQKVLYKPTPQDLLDNWANIVYERNNTPERLNNKPLTESEKGRLLDVINSASNPYKIQNLLQGEDCTITRDSGEIVNLNIFKLNEVAGGSSTYQIARQPFMPRAHWRDKDRRADLMLLVFGIPLIHIELKNHGNALESGIYQIGKYLSDGVLNEGVYRALQVFVSMTPEKMLYLARPSTHEKISSAYCFEYSDKNNEHYTKWQDIAREFLSIPFAHKLIADYLIADAADEELKIMRPYQIHAVEAVKDRMKEIGAIKPAERSRNDHKGGYVWHTTGSGKTVTSFKAASLLTRSKQVHKVVFVLDRIELGNQSETEYRNFAGDSVDIARPKNTGDLARELIKGTNPLIITSLHKLGRLTDPAGDYAKRLNFAEIQEKNIVFILDEAHRSTFGEMYINLRASFPNAVFFGFTGTPILDLNAKKDTTTVDLFGDELHQYSLRYGLRDKSVLPFSTQTVEIPKADELREKIALRQAKASRVTEAVIDKQKNKIYYKFCDDKETPMVSDKDQRIKGLEDYLTNEDFEQPERKEEVVKDLLTKWVFRSRGGKLHGIFAANSISNAIEYYRLFKQHNERVAAYQKDPNQPEPTPPSKIKVTAVFTDADSNTPGQSGAANAIIEILEDYEELFGKRYDRAQFQTEFKEDVADRLAHKGSYSGVSAADQLDLVIVVNQLLTGYDSKYVGTLYLDRILEYAELVQAASRTNRIYDDYEKPHGTIIFYRKPHTMEENIKEAFNLYAGGDAKRLFVDDLQLNLKNLDAQYQIIENIFKRSGISDYRKLPESNKEKRAFAAEYAKLAKTVETVRLQGFKWGSEPSTKLSDKTYEILTARYAEIEKIQRLGKANHIPYNFSCSRYAQEPKMYDYDTLAAQVVNNKNQMTPAEVLICELRDRMNTLSQQDQAAARRVLKKTRDGVLTVDDQKTFRDYVNEEAALIQRELIDDLVAATGVDRAKMDAMFEKFGGRQATDKDLNNHNQLNDLRNTVDYEIFARWLETNKAIGAGLKEYEIKRHAKNLIKDFILNGGFDLADWNPT